MTHQLSPAQRRLLILIKNVGKRDRRPFRRHYRITTWQALLRRGLVDVAQQRLPTRLSWWVVTAAGEEALHQTVAVEPGRL